MSADLPISEQYRIVAKQWCDAEAAASLLEDTKSAMLSTRIRQLIESEPGIALNRAEAEVKSSAEWHEWIVGMVDARKKANLLKVQLKYLEMKDGERASREATKRAEMRL
jgi:hypothetical protein